MFRADVRPLHFSRVVAQRGALQATLKDRRTNIESVLHVISTASLTCFKQYMPMLRSAAHTAGLTTSPRGLRKAMARRSSSVPVDRKAIKAIKRAGQTSLLEQDKAESWIISPPKAAQLDQIEVAREVDVCVLSVSGDLLREQTIRSDRPVMDLALPWCQILDGDYQEIPPACMIGEVAKGESTATITLVHQEDFSVHAGWEDEPYVKAVLGHHLDSTTDARHVAKALELLTKTSAFFNKEGGDFVLASLGNLKAACQQEGSVPEHFPLLRPFLQSMLRCFKCRLLSSECTQSCNVNGYRLQWSCKGVQGWKKACFAQRGTGCAFQKMKEILTDLVDVVLVDGPECEGAVRDRYTEAERKLFMQGPDAARAEDCWLAMCSVCMSWTLITEIDELRAHRYRAMFKNEPTFFAVQPASMDK